jgi:hypothetical protein
MGGECFICSEPAAGRYTLILEGSDHLEDKLVCEECLVELREIEWIEIRE